MMKDSKHLYRLRMAAAAKTREKDYWLARLAGEPSRSSFPPRFNDAGPDGVDRLFGVSQVDLPGEVTAGLLKLGGGSDVRMYIILAAGLTALLHYYTGNEDIILGTPILGTGNDRNLINTAIALRNRLDRSMTFKELLLGVKQSIAEANEHRNYPIELLTGQLSIPDTGNGFPLFDTALLVEGIQARESLRHIDLNMIFSFTRAGDRVTGQVEYNPARYDEAGVKQVAGHFIRLLGAVLVNGDIRLGDVEILSGEEKRQLLLEFNDTASNYPYNKTIHELFEEQVRRKPDSIAAAGPYQAHEVHITYGELNRGADCLARELNERGVCPGDIVGIMAERSIQTITGILAILKAGGAYLPIESDYPRERIDYMLTDSSARFLLTAPGELLKPREGPVVHHSSFIDHHSSSLAYVIYTSGTTGKPKGVMVEHRNVVRLVVNTDYIEFKESDRILQTGALAFDASTFEIWGALLNGLMLCLASKEDTITAGNLREVLERYDISTTWMTSSLFNRMLDEDAAMFAGLDNLLVGGEALSPLHINKLRKKYSKLRIIDGYGPTENTTFSTAYQVEREHRESIPIGGPIANSTAYIVDRRGKLAPLGAVGELWVGGDGVSRGYLNSPELTAEKFLPDPYRSYRTNRTYISKRLYKTGDLARWLPDGGIEFIGRLDDQVKIRGFRIEPGEIEYRLLHHEKVKEAAVLADNDESGETYLCAYIVTRGEFILNELREYLAKNLPAYMIPAHIVPLERFPLTANGKLDRKDLPKPASGMMGGGVPPRDEAEKKLSAIWLEVLGRTSDTGSAVDIDANFFEIGGHSLKAASMLSRIHREFNVRMPMADLFQQPTIRRLAAHIKRLNRQEHRSMEPAEQREYYPLSSAQKRLYILQQVDSTGIGYNIPEFMILKGKLDREKFETVFKKLIRRHESLRTSFVMINNEPVQRVHEEVSFAVEYGERDERIQEFVRPFDLTRAPLLRVGLARSSTRERDEDEHILMVDMHHIISDGYSMGIVVREFMALYRGEDLTPLDVQYKDFSQWRDSEREKKALNKQEAYWLEQFSGGAPVLELPADYARPLVQDFAGSQLSFTIGKEQTRRLNALALNEEASLYMVLLALFNILLAKLCGRDDIVVGSPTAGRRHGDLENIIGMFVNTLVLRNYPTGEKSFRQFLREVKERTLAAFENQDYQFEDLVEKLAINRDTARNPLFDVMFVLQNLDISELSIPGLTLLPYKYESGVSKFDMTWSCSETPDDLYFSVTYCSKLFKAETAARFAGCFKKLAATLTADPELLLADIEIVTGEEKQRILYEFNDTRMEAPDRSTVHQLFEKQAAANSDRAAVVWGEHTVTYGMLNAAADELAYGLREKGTGPGAAAAVMMEPCIDMLVGILAILKTGGAYLPIDPGYPGERVKYMLDDSGAVFLLTAESMAIIKGEFCTGTPPCPTLPVTDNHPAYVIYTSGTTGRPKGVIIEHRSLMSMCRWHNEYFEVTMSDHASKYAGVAFDASVVEIFPNLFAGACIYIVANDIKLDMQRLNEYFETSDITIAFLPTQVCEQFMVLDNRSLRVLFTGGDKLNRYIPRQYCLVNDYGPTESTVVATSFIVDRNDGNIPIGKPIANTRIYILDSRLPHVQPIGVVGELCVAGDGLARGYLNRPELTAEKFNRSYNTGISPGKIYKTGDLARWLPDGNIEFLGRRDNQVKIRGFRIELGEIETRLVSHPAIEEAVVTTVEGVGGDRPLELCAYIVTREEGLENIQIKDYLLRSLPEYMIPSYFQQLEKIPLTHSGKVDRKALPLPGRSRSHSTAAYVEPATELEKIVAQTWKEVLEIETVGLDDNFFELGGNSLNIIQLNDKLKQALARDIPAVILFRYPKISSFVEYLNETDGTTAVQEEETKRTESVKMGKNMMKQAMQRRRRR
jgi:amino acid adenylation domain-containing protein